MEILETIPVNSQNGQMKFSLVSNYRKIVIDTDIDENVTLELLYYFSKIKDNDEKYNKKEPIEIYVNSNGGVLSECASIVDLIENMKDIGYEIITINMGRAFSAGMAIALCGSKRKAFKRARYMFHDVSAGTVGKLRTMTEDIEEFNIGRKTYFDIIRKYTNITDKDMNLWQERKMDKYFSAKEMLELEGVDEII